MKGYCVSLGTYFTESPLPDRFALAVDAGFEAVELALPYFETAEKLSRCRQASDVPVVLFTAPLGDFMEGGEGIASVPGRQAEFQDSVSIALEYADALSANYVQFVAGRCIDPSSSVRERYAETYRDNLAYAVEAFSSRATEILIEPINSLKFEDFLIDFPSKARKLETGLSLVFDTVHLAAMGVELAEEWRLNSGDYAHVQIADLPDRAFPGTGVLNFPDLMQAIEESSYAGWIGSECWPQGAEQSTRSALESALSIG